MSPIITMTDAEFPVDLQIEGGENPTSLVFLPHARREDGAPVFAQSTKSVQKILQDGGVQAALAPSQPTDKPAIYRDEHGLEWLGPIIWISTAILAQNPAAVAISLNLISAYLYSIFTGRESETTAKLTVVVEKTKGRSSKKIDYQGPVAGLAALAAAVEQAIKEGESNK